MKFKLYNFKNTPLIKERDFQRLVMFDLEKSGFTNIKKEYTINGGRADIYAEYGEHIFLFELKDYRKRNPKIISDALYQMLKYYRNKKNVIPVIGLMDLQSEYNEWNNNNRSWNTAEARAIEQLLNFICHFGICILEKSPDNLLRIRYSETVTIFENNNFIEKNFNRIKNKIINNRFRKLIEVAEE